MNVNESEKEDNSLGYFFESVKIAPLGRFFLYLNKLFLIRRCVMTKQCPLYPNGICDYPDMLERFPQILQDQCSSGAQCLLRRVTIPETDDGSGNRLNLVRIRLFNDRFSFCGLGFPPEKVERGIYNYVREVSA
jgi:hypothetical protein